MWHYSMLNKNSSIVPWQPIKSMDSLCSVVITTTIIAIIMIMINLIFYNIFINKVTKFENYCGQILLLCLSFTLFHSLTLMSAVGRLPSSITDSVANSRCAISRSRQHMFKLISISHPNHFFVFFCHIHTQKNHVPTFSHFRNLKEDFA